jgi:hypothetical protein
MAFTTRTDTLTTLGSWKEFKTTNNVLWILLALLKNGGRNRRKCEFGVVKGAGQSGVQSECAGTTCFRRLVQKDSCGEHEQTRQVVQSPSNGPTYSVRNQKQRCWRCLFVFYRFIIHTFLKQKNLKRNVRSCPRVFSPKPSVSETCRFLIFSF